MTTALHVTVDEFDTMVDRGAFDHLNRKIELIRGKLYEMNPAGPLHDDLITFLTHWSSGVLAEKPMLVTSQTGLGLNALESRPEPDLLWIDKKRYRDRHPSASNVHLAIEVSDSSLQYDLQLKAQLYAEAEILEYWIVDAKSSCIHVYRHPVGGRYSDLNVAHCGDQISALAAPDAMLDVRELFEGD
ncbi:Uma2 family endonuclease [Rhodopirellula sp. JC639]|uniref:Uma2 family endonuclease n=1 Tax=Stieleria mannarensis TaxID=2755585 RepID=UPI0015FF81F7|nr:Uma2 family endonuclease [Rhodopirellula sp. JC639]